MRGSIIKLLKSQRLTSSFANTSSNFVETSEKWLFNGRELFIIWKLVKLKVNDEIMQHFNALFSLDCNHMKYMWIKWDVSAIIICLIYIKISLCVAFSCSCLLPLHEGQNLIFFKKISRLLIPLISSFDKYDYHVAMIKF